MMDCNHYLIMILQKIKEIDWYWQLPSGWAAYVHSESEDIVSDSDVDIELKRKNTKIVKTHGKKNHLLLNFKEVKDWNYYKIHQIQEEK